MSVSDFEGAYCPPTPDDLTLIAEIAARLSALRARFVVRDSSYGYGSHDSALRKRMSAKRRAVEAIFDTLNDAERVLFYDGELPTEAS